MGFSSVYKVLQEVFPQVDSRILRAVALEHSKDADLAVEVVLTEVIPNLAEQSLAAGSSSNSKNSLIPSEDKGKTSQLESTLDSADIIPGLPKLLNESGPSSVGGSLPGAKEAVNAGFSVQPISSTVVDKSFYHDANGETDGEPIVLEKYGDKSITELDSDSLVLIRKRRSYDNNDQNVNSLVESVVSDAEVSGSFHEEVSHHLDVSAIEAEDNYIHLNVDTLKFIDPANKESERNFSSKIASEKEAFAIENVNSENESTMSYMVNISDEKCSTELLAEIIEDARNSKKTLMLAMNSVVDLMREVEHKEKAAELVKEQAIRDCSDIFSKVDELKQTLQRAKEANYMHAGEVYAEKSILATECKEFQLRLFTLSDERNKSLEILDEMRKALEIRLATALEQIASAEEEKVKQEMTAREALLYQESQMEKVVEESKKLKLEAEENSKLQEFLMDRGRAIDILQGEFSVTCQDVLLLKEKFEKRFPISRSLSSSQASSILNASSNSSFRSTTRVIRTPVEPEYEIPKKGTELDDSYGFLESPKSPINTGDYFQSEVEKRVEDRKKLLEDGWELFENGDLLTK